MSILHYQPTPNFKDTGRNVRQYLTEHMDAFWDIFKPLMPYIAICSFLDLVITEHFMPIHEESGEPHGFMLFLIIANYFLFCLVISWHRVIIHGPDNYTPMSPFKPTRGEMVFIAMGLGLTIAALAIGAIVGFISALIGPFLLGISIFALFIVFIHIGCRLSFYFPAKATGNDITLKKAYALSEGYVLRLVFTPLLASWRLILLMLAYYIMGFLVLLVVGSIFGSYIESGAGAVLAQFLYMLPVDLFFSPVLTVIGVTVLSNYYQYALQNPRKNSDDEHYI